MQSLVDGLAYAGAVWSAVVFTVQGIGSFQLFRNNSRPPPPPVSPSLDPKDVPHITIIRPVKGLEPRMYECLASSCLQSYPRDKLSIRLCISSKDDAGYATLERIVADFASTELDIQILLESEDPFLHGAGGNARNLGPNPKVRNISRAYREAKGDIIWVVDCNIWVSKHAAGRMVDKLLGLAPAGSRGTLPTPYKFVHQLPVSVDVTPADEAAAMGMMAYGGGRLDEMFMASTHAKFYSAINTVGVAPCICGKSNMFRKSHIDRLTDPAQNPILTPEDASRGRGIDFFSSYICEDHLIGDLLWRSEVPGHARHGLVHGELALQPMRSNTVTSYIARRVRWLRVRKWTVIAATLVEPGVESLVCCMAFAFAVTTAPWAGADWPVPRTWTAYAQVFAAAITCWVVLDRAVYRLLHACRSVETDSDSPDFARGAGRPGGPVMRSFPAWLLAWVGRELLALPIWTWAVLLGGTVTWRGQSFRVRMDMSVVELPDQKGARGGGAASRAGETARLIPNGSASKKPRRT
ncbi:hypothetical protein RB594_009155 [Gaeumannomyces avenae]